MRTRSYPLLLALVAFVAGGTTFRPAPALANPSILIDANTGRVLESEDATRRWYPASLSKLMTTYVAFRAIQAGEVTLDSPVRISKAAANLPPSKMGYKPGSILTLDNALKIIMVKSANDVARSIGESIAGSQEAFAERMNAESRRLGMTDSHWVNPHGLHDAGQYSSPRDMALLATALRREFPAYAAFFSIEGLAVDNKILPNHNNLIGRYDGADGMKTGYTCPAGFNLVASATRNGRTLMAIVVGSESVPDRDEKAAAMLERGFRVATGTGPMINQLVASTPTGPVDMTQALCSKEARAKRAKAQKELAAKIKAGLAVAAVHPYEEELPRPRNLIAVALGGASGPAAPSMAEVEVESDVPIPTWRPDMPPPDLKAGAQGDAADPAK